MSAGDELDLTRLAEIPDPIGARIGASASNVDAVSESVRSKVVAEPPTLTRGDVRRRRVIALAVSAVWLSALLFAVGFQRDVTAARTAFLGQVVLPGVLGVVALYLALARGRIGLGPRLGWLVAATLAAPLAFALFALASSTSLVAGEATMVKHAAACCAVALLVSTVPMVSAMVALRRACVTGASWRSALVGVSVGLVSAAVLGMHCSSTDGAHLLAGHVTPVLLLAASAVVVVRRFARAD